MTTAALPSATSGPGPRARARPRRYTDGRVRENCAAVPRPGDSMISDASNSADRISILRLLPRRTTVPSILSFRASEVDPASVTVTVKPLVTEPEYGKLEREHSVSRRGPTSPGGPDLDGPWPRQPPREPLPLLHTRQCAGPQRAAGGRSSSSTTTVCACPRSSPGAPPPWGGGPPLSRGRAW